MLASIFSLVMEMTDFETVSVQVSRQGLFLVLLKLRKEKMSAASVAI
jgi:hypothetical protein